MTVFEYALARHAHRLLEESKERPLTPRERGFLVKVERLMSRIKLRENMHDQTATRCASDSRD